MALEEVGNYTLGKGKLFLARGDGRGAANGFAFVGNAPTFGVTVESENLDHFSSTGGIRELDASVQTQTTRSGSLVLDDIQPENLAYFFQGAASQLIQAANVTQVLFEIDSVKLDAWYQLGATDANPVGVSDVATVTAGDDAYVVAPAAGSAFAAGDYTVNEALGLIRFNSSGGTAPTEGDTVRAYYALSAIADTEQRTRVVTSGESAKGALKFIQDNPEGSNRIYNFLNIVLTANGEMALIGDDWQTIPLSVRILKPTWADVQAVIVDRMSADAVAP